MVIQTFKKIIYDMKLSISSENRFCVCSCHNNDFNSTPLFIRKKINYQESEVIYCKNETFNFLTSEEIACTQISVANYDFSLPCKTRELKSKNINGKSGWKCASHRQHTMAAGNLGFLVKTKNQLVPWYELQVPGSQADNAFTSKHKNIHCKT